MDTLVWNSMLSAQMSACYWNKLAYRYFTREKYIKIFLALTSSGTVASWTFWSHYELIWKLLSGLSAILAVALPILDYSGRVEKITKLAGACAQLRAGYELLWAQLTALSPAAIQDAVEKLQRVDNETSGIQATLPDDQALLERCQHEVLTSRGLIQP